MRIEVHPRSKRWLPILALGALSCTPIFRTTLVAEYVGCISSEEVLPESTNSEGRPIPERHQLTVIIPRIGRKFILESNGSFSREINSNFNVNDPVQLTLTFSQAYNPLNSQGRETADAELNRRLARTTNSRVIALDETKESNHLDKIPGGSCMLS